MSPENNSSIKIELIAPILVLIAGILVPIYLLDSFRNQAFDKKINQFNHSQALLYESIQQELRDRKNVLDILGSFFAASDGVSEQEFNTFLEGLPQRHQLTAICWHSVDLTVNIKVGKEKLCNSFDLINQQKVLPDQSLMMYSAFTKTAKGQAGFASIVFSLEKLVVDHFPKEATTGRYIAVFDTIDKNFLNFRSIETGLLRDEFTHQLDDFKIRSVAGFEGLEVFLLTKEPQKSEINLSTNEKIISGLACFAVISMGFFLFHLIRTKERISHEVKLQTLALSNANQQLEDSNTQLVRSNKELEQFAYAASHDLKSPLRGFGNLRDYVEEDLAEFLEKDGEAQQEIKKNLTHMKRLVNRMNNLITGLLEYASVNYHKPKIETFDAREVMLDIVDDLGSSLNKIDIPDESFHIEGEQLRFYQILSNLVSNSIKHHHSPGDAMVEIKGETKGPFYQFTIIDNGPGIDSRFHSKIFELFQTLKPKDEVESTGMGLTMVKKIVESKGGKIWLTSVPGKGSKFSFTWPNRERSVKR